MRYLIVLLLISGALNMRAQCTYMRNNEIFYPVDTVNFGNNNILGIFAEKSTRGKTIFYSGTTVKSCFDTSTLFDMWDDGRISCTINRRRDTLIISEYTTLPIGKNFAYIDTPFFISKIFFIGNHAKVLNSFNNRLRKYTASEIESILQLPSAKKPNNNTTITNGYRLFWAAVSGSKKASIRLNSMITNLHGFDGAYAEDWDDLVATYELWKQQHTR